jgi:hypothetical protein
MEFPPMGISRIQSKYFKRGAQLLTMLGVLCFVIGCYHVRKSIHLKNTYNEICSYKSTGCKRVIEDGKVVAYHNVKVTPSEASYCTGSTDVVMRAQSCDVDDNIVYNYRYGTYKPVDVCQQHNCVWDKGERAELISSAEFNSIISFVFALIFIIIGTPVWIAEAELEKSRNKHKNKV